MTNSQRDSIQSWIKPVLTSLMVVAVCWLTREVICLRRDYVELSARIQERQVQNDRDQRIEKDMQLEFKTTMAKLNESVNRLDKNVVRLCTQAGVKYD